VSLLGPTGVLVPRAVPIELDREDARQLAERELADPVYEDEPTLTERVIRWVLDRIDDLLNGAAGVSPGGWLALALLAALVALIGGVVARTVRARARTVTDPGAVFAARTLTAAEHLAAADEAAARGDWETAVRERFRGIVRRLEERGVIDASAGRTAEELSREAGAWLPELAGDLMSAAFLFDRVQYGGSAATAGDDAALRTLAESTAHARPALEAATPAAPAVPR